MVWEQGDEHEEGYLHGGVVWVDDSGLSSAVFLNVSKGDHRPVCWCSSRGRNLRGSVVNS